MLYAVQPPEHPRDELVRPLTKARPIERVDGERRKPPHPLEGVDPADMYPLAALVGLSNQLLGVWPEFPCCRAADEEARDLIPRHGQRLLPVLCDKGDRQLVVVERRRPEPEAGDSRGGIRYHIRRGHEQQARNISGGDLAEHLDIGDTIQALIAIVVTCPLHARCNDCCNAVAVSWCPEPA